MIKAAHVSILDISTIARVAGMEQYRAISNKRSNEQIDRQMDEPACSPPGSPLSCEKYFNHTLDRSVLYRSDFRLSNHAHVTYSFGECFAEDCCFFFFAIGVNSFVN